MNGWLRRAVLADVLRARLDTVRLIAAVDPRVAALLAVTVAVGAVLPPLFALATGWLVGNVPPAVRDGPGSRSGRALVASLVVVGALFVGQQLLAPVRLWLTNVLHRAVEGHVRERVMGAVLRPPGVQHLEDPKLHDMVETSRGITVWGASPGFAVMGFAAMWSTRLAGVGSLLLVARYRIWVAAMLAAVALLVIRAKRNLYFHMITQITSKAEDLRRSRYFREVALGAEAAKESRVFGLGNWALGRFDDAWLAAMADAWRARRRGSPAVVLAMLVRGVAAVGALALMARSAVRGDLGLGPLVVGAQAVIGTGNLSYTLGNPEVFIEQGVAAVGPIHALERTAATLEMRGTGRPDGLPRHAIRFEDVGFAYPGREELLFRCLDLEIPAGRSLAIVGANGAGKTTIVKLLARLYDPSHGRVTVDGIDLRDLDARAWQRRVAAIFQDFVKYPLTAAENIGYGAVERLGERDALVSAARRAGVLDVVERVGWDTVLDRRFDDGIDLSGGEWQRICLARALFAIEGGAGVLVLDEPTAHLDVRSEATLYDRFLDLTRGLTTIVISHRFSTVRRADRIVVIEDGVVTETGTHDELVAVGGRYAHMFTLQAARFWSSETSDCEARSAEQAGSMSDCEARSAEQAGSMSDCEARSAEQAGDG